MFLPYATDSAIIVAAKMSFMMMLVVRTLGMDNGCRMIFLSSNLILNANIQSLVLKGHSNMINNIYNQDNDSNDI